MLPKSYFRANLTSMSSHSLSTSTLTMSLNTPLLALRNIGLSTRDLMEAINRRHSYIDNDIDGYATGQNALLFPAQPISKEAAIVDEFTCFGQLPSEIRIKIWQYVCYHPRKHTIESIPA